MDIGQLRGLLLDLECMTALRHTLKNKAVAALAALYRAYLTHLFQIAAQFIDPAANVAAVAFQFTFARTARADSAAQSGK